MKRLTLVAIAAVLFCIGSPGDAVGQTTVAVGPRLGIDFGDVEEVFIGADARIMSPDLPVVINPTFDFYFTDDPLTFWSLSANGLYMIETENPSLDPYVGAGLGIYRTSVDVDTGFGSFGASSTDIGINLLAGAQFPLETVTPFAEAQFSPVFTSGDTTTLFNIKGGVLFTF